LQFSSNSLRRLTEALSVLGKKGVLDDNATLTTAFEYLDEVLQEQEAVFTPF